MKQPSDQIRNWGGRKSIAQDVDEELRFHLDRRAQDYEREGLSLAESRLKAEQRFGDVERIREQCIQISSQNTTGVWAMKLVFAVIFLVGVLIRTLTLDFRVTRIGHILMAIAILGGLLLYGRRLGAIRFNSENEQVKLGLANGASPIPRSFDEKGQTPFDRVRSDD